MDISHVDLLKNATDADGDTLSIIDINGWETDTQYGEITFSDDSVNYKPAANYYWTDEF
jgi:hypothetical protein